jgi:hypothetical protein
MFQNTPSSVLLPIPGSTVLHKRLMKNELGKCLRSKYQQSNLVDIPRRPSQIHLVKLAYLPNSPLSPIHAPHPMCFLKCLPVSCFVAVKTFARSRRWASSFPSVVTAVSAGVSLGWFNRYSKAAEMLRVVELLHGISSVVVLTEFLQ